MFSSGQKKNKSSEMFRVKISTVAYSESDLSNIPRDIFFIMWILVHTINCINVTTGQRKIITGQPNVLGYKNGLDARFHNPYDVVVDRARGRLYISG